MAKLLRGGTGSASSFSSGGNLAALDGHGCNGGAFESSLSSEHAAYHDDTHSDDFEEAAEVCCRPSYSLGTDTIIFWPRNCVGAICLLYQ